jgi:hypothetical protein
MKRNVVVGLVVGLCVMPVFAAGPSEQESASLEMRLKSSEARLTALEARLAVDEQLLQEVVQGQSVVIQQEGGKSATVRFADTVMSIINLSGRVGLIEKNDNDHKATENTDELEVGPPAPDGGSADNPSPKPQEQVKAAEKNDNDHKATENTDELEVGPPDPDGA